MGRPRLMTDEMEHLLWEDVDKRRGIDSLWLTDFDQAYSELQALWVTKGFLNNLTGRQIKNFFGSASTRHTKSRCRTSDLFLKGTTLLKPKSTSTDHADEKRKVTSTQIPAHSSPWPAYLNARSGSHAIARKIRSAGHIAEKPCAPYAAAIVRSVASQQVDVKRVALQPMLRVDLKLTFQSASHTTEKEKDATHDRTDILGEAENRSELAVALDEPSPWDEDGLNHEIPPRTGTTASVVSPFSRGMGRIRDLMAVDPETFSPRDEELVQLRNKAIQSITSAAEHMIGQERWKRHPQFWEAVRYHQSFNLLKRMYGTGSSAEELLERAENLSQQSLTSVKVTLQALIGVAVYEWVFEARHESLSMLPHGSLAGADGGKTRESFAELLKFEHSEHDLIFGQLVSNAYPEFHEHLVLKSKFLFVQQKFRPERFATELACRLSSALKAFLDENLWIWGPEAVNDWIEDLKKVFTAALRLKAQTSLEAEQFIYRWPRANDPMDNGLMEIHRDSPNTDPRDLVHFALFPALLRVKEERDPDYRRIEELVFRAVVLRQGR
ncbi:MAG: hypothetical protein Q9220_004299 [cf. Caloplaca sp. 1 TL-2023]